MNNTSLTADADGNKVLEIRYKAWGEIRATWTSSPSTTPAYKMPLYQYTGQASYMDDPLTSGVTEGFGLMFYNARWYDPYINHFVQADTIIPGGAQGLDRYAAMGNNPVKYTDPSGHRECDYDCQVEYEDADPAYEHYCEGCEWDVAEQERNEEIAEAILYGGTEFAASVLFEPADWVFTASHCFNGDCSPLMLLGLLPIIPASLGSRGDDFVDLYRAVGPDELADIEKTGIIRVDPSGASFSTGKWFATTAQDAAKWGEAMSSWSGKGFSVIQAAVPKSVLGQLDFVAKLDGIGPAYFAPNNLLSYFSYVKK